jgi:hypothetical protein
MIPLRYDTGDGRVTLPPLGGDARLFVNDSASPLASLPFVFPRFFGSGDEYGNAQISALIPSLLPTIPFIKEKREKEGRGRKKRCAKGIRARGVTVTRADPERPSLDPNSPANLPAHKTGEAR